MDFLAKKAMIANVPFHTFCCSPEHGKILAFVSNSVFSNVGLGATPSYLAYFSLLHEILLG